ncbi:MAG: DNA polymerase III subunit gamma/tau [Prochloraceae cyanobacterium]|nr:DNA polymerase III subunit gamma/tau [Prochloraceae cyanobacterium]
MSYQPLHHKYRPQTFAELVGQDAIATTLTNAVESDRIAPAYLFAGPRGTGKTSSARILAKSLNCLEADRPTARPCGICEVCRAIAAGSAMDVIEIDAASNTGVDNIRDIIERSQFAPVQSRYKVYAIDECHMLSIAAFNALLKTLEEPPPRVVFILATTDPQRVLPTIISRTQRFDFRRIPLVEMVNHLTRIAELEKIKIDSEAITLVGQIANGGLRDAQSLLDRLSLLSGDITSDRVWDQVGAVAEIDLLAILRSIRSDRTDLLLQQCRNLIDRGREPLIILQNLANFYLNLAIAKTAPDSKDLVAVTTSTWEQLQLEAKEWSIADILRGQEQLKASEFQIKTSNVSRLWLEITLLGLLPSNNRGEEGDLVKNEVKITSQPQVTSQLSAKIAPKSSQNGAAPPQQKTKTIPIDQSQNNFEQVSTANNNSVEIANNIEDSNELVLPEIWQKVVAKIESAYTKVLAEKYCNLIAFDGSLAKVEISNQGFYDQLYPRIRGVEVAFNSACDRKVKVNLQIAANQNLSSASDVKNKDLKKSSPPFTEPRVSPAKKKITKPAAIAPVASVPEGDSAKKKPAKTNSDSLVNLAEVAGQFAEVFQGETIDLDLILENNLAEKLSESEFIAKGDRTDFDSHLINAPEQPQVKLVGKPEDNNEEDF